MTTLSESNVRDIFASVHGNKVPQLPPHLQYQVVPPQQGLKLCPLPFQYSPGLYIILKPKRRGPTVQVPSHLCSLVKENTNAACRWTLGSPQHSLSSEFQQRDSYPTADGSNSDYCAGIRASMWTKYGPDGTEDLDYRLLHVYASDTRQFDQSGPASKRSKVDPSLEPVLVDFEDNARPATPPVLVFDARQDFQSYVSDKPLKHQHRVDPHPRLEATATVPQPNDVEVFMNQLTCTHIYLHRKVSEMKNGSLQELCKTLLVKWAKHVMSSPLGDFDPELLDEIESQWKESYSFPDLEYTQECIKARIFAMADAKVQEQCTSLLIGWAGQVALTPLAGATASNTN